MGFRWFVRECAQRLELAGWVRNEPDGSVSLEVAGDPAALEALAAQLRVGPPGASVSSLISETVGTTVWELPTPFVVQR